MVGMRKPKCPHCHIIYDGNVIHQKERLVPKYIIKRKWLKITIEPIIEKQISKHCKNCGNTWIANIDVTWSYSVWRDVKEDGL